MGNLFVKSESSYNGAYGNYKGVGLRVKTENFGTTEVMFAGKANDSGTGRFGEFKYTTPKVGNWALESRTRYQKDKPDDSSIYSNSIGQRVAAKWSKDFSEDWNAYAIGGVNSKISLNKDSNHTVTPMLLGGIGYNITNKCNVYGEVEIAKSCNLNENKWNDSSTTAYLGVKYTF